MAGMGWYYKGTVHEIGFGLMGYENIWWMAVVVKNDGCGGVWYIVG